MVDKTKLKKLAKIMTEYSMEVKKGEKVLIRGYGFESYPLVKEIYRECIKAGAVQVDVRFSEDELSKIFFENASEAQMKYLNKLELDVAKSYDCMAQIIADRNPYELASTDIKKINIVQRARKPLSDILHQKKWILFYYPNASSAQIAKRDLEEWEDFVFDCCLIDWKKEKVKQEKFINVLKKVKKIKITGKETNLEVAVAGQKWQTCCGERNLPDGEVFTSPLRTGVNGTIKYNVPTNYQSHDFDWVKLTLKNGKVVKEESNNQKALTEILNSDEGSKYYGEFAFGLNKKIVKPTKQILFDEKMGHSLHMALGKCYEECPNGNDSLIHWDLIFRFEWAGAEVFFDGKKVLSNNKWTDKRLTFLN